MFAESVVQEKLELFAAEFGWTPEPHSIEEVDSWSKRLLTAFITDPKGNILQCRDLTKKEHRFIANERAMCVASCGYFLTHYYWIKAKSKVFRFAFRQGQWILWQMLCEMDKKGFSKQAQILKARQLGISTLAEGIMLWGALFVAGSAGQIGSADAQKTQSLLGMLLFAKDQISDLYPWLPPDETRSKRAADRPIINFEKIGTSVIVQHGAMRGGMGQGSTPTMVHLSECSQYTDPVKQIDEGLLKSLHAGPELVVLLESTGDASHRSSWWWKRKWEWNRDRYWKGEARMLPVFLPWHTTPEMYPGDWIKEHPVPSDFKPNDATISHVLRCEAYVQSTPMLRTILGEGWEMPVEQKWFWQFNYNEALGQRVEKSWIRQMPGDDIEALLGERDKVYSRETIEIVSKTVAPLEKTLVYGLVGDDIPERRTPDLAMVWNGEDAPARLRTHWTTPKGIKLEWMFVPLHPGPELAFDPLGKFLIYEEARVGFDYSVGADFGSGSGGDRSVFNVTRHGTDDEPDVQVAEFASDNIALGEIYVYLAALTSLYSKFLTRKPHPKLCPEMNYSAGDLPYHMLRGMGFRRWHEWGQGFDRKLFREHQSNFKNPRMGWLMNGWSRTLLLSAFQAALDGNWYQARSKWLAQEVANVEQKIMESGRTRQDHAVGEHDDRLIAAALAYWTLHQSDVMAERAKKRYDSPNDAELEVEHGPAVLTTTIGGERKWALAS